MGHGSRDLPQTIQGIRFHAPAHSYDVGFGPFFNEWHQLCGLSHRQNQHAAGKGIQRPQVTDFFIARFSFDKRPQRSRTDSIRFIHP